MGHNQIGVSVHKNTPSNSSQPDRTGAPVSGLIQCSIKTEKKIRRFNHFGKDIRDRKEADPFRSGKDYSIRPEAASDPGTDP